MKGKRRCRVCKKTKEENQFYLSHIKKCDYRCINCVKEIARKRYEDNKEHCKKISMRYYYKHKKEYKQKRWKLALDIHKKAIKILGGKCIICGIDDLRILQINHIDGEGTKEYKKIGNYIFYKSIIDGKRNLDDLDVRCANHNILYEYETGRRKWKTKS